MFSRPITLPQPAGDWQRLPHRSEVGTWTFRHVDSGTEFVFKGEYGEAAAALDLDFFEQNLPEGIWELTNPINRY